MSPLPDVVGMPLAQAQDRCRQAGFEIVLRRTGPPWPFEQESSDVGHIVRAVLLAPAQVELTVAPGEPQRCQAVLPRHLAIICDGNGRWAEARGLDRHQGHRAGTENVRRVVEWCSELGIAHLSLYAFSTENWRRPKSEVDGLMSLIVEGARSAMDSLGRSGVRLRVLGRVDGLPAPVRDTINRVTAATASSTGMTVNLLLNYGGRADVLEACRLIMRQALDGQISPDELTEDLFAKHLATAGLPDPDLIIRTAGDLRLSNFLIWQGAYSELHFTPVLWPAFRRGDLLAAIDDYARRQRRFGGLDPEDS